MNVYPALSPWPSVLVESENCPAIDSVFGQGEVISCVSSLGRHWRHASQLHDAGPCQVAAGV